MLFENFPFYQLYLTNKKKFQEKEEGLEISAMCDRETANVEKSQVKA